MANASFVWLVDRLVADRSGKAEKQSTLASGLGDGFG
jgi:hypothetical protein